MFINIYKHMQWSLGSLHVSSQWSSQLLWSSFVYHCGRYSTGYNHLDRRFLEVPQFCSHVHEKHFGNSFDFDAPTVLNNLSDEVHSAPTLTCFRIKIKLYLLKEAFPT